ncbi:MAG TPA: hypothetical protein VJZ00_13430 [Thermoanaerobaculia bacterium]|nr:hypothetical protein [Thermoanaerobaculia bacterium]
MAVTADLKIQLLANTVLVAESEDAELWRRVFTAIQKGSTKLELGDGPRTDSDEDAAAADERTRPARQTSGSEIERFANEIGVDVDDVVGSLDPSSEPPYLHLNAHNWEALKKNTPSRGPASVAPITLAATVLALWAGVAGLPAPNVSQCIAVLETINLSGKNAHRGIRNCEWLQLRGDTVIVNPSRRSRAVRLTRGYCTTTSPGNGD